MAPLGARAADLVVWWDKGYYPEEDEAVREIVAAFEQKTGKQVELVLHPAQELPDKLVAAVEAGQPPDFVFGMVDHPTLRAMGLRGSAGRPHGRHRPLLRTCSIRTRSTWSPCSTRRPAGAASTCCRWAFATHHVHVWKSLLEQAGFTLEDIPKEWEAFWSFWCDQVQPAVRKAWAATTSGASALPCRSSSVDTLNGFWQFVDAYEADYVTRDGRLVIDDPEVRRRLIKALDGYTAIYRKGCTPPDSVDLGPTATTTRRSWRRRS